MQEGCASSGIASAGWLLLFQQFFCSPRPWVQPSLFLPCSLEPGGSRKDDHAFQAFIKGGFGWLHSGSSPLSKLDETRRLCRTIPTDRSSKLHIRTKGLGTGSSLQAPAPALQPFASQQSCLASSLYSTSQLLQARESLLVQTRHLKLYADHEEDVYHKARQCSGNEKRVRSL